jgi:hypothetical protein
LLFLHPDETPNFVALDASAVEIAQVLILILLAGFPNVGQQLENRMHRDARYARDRIDASALDKQRDDLRAPF